MSRDHFSPLRSSHVSVTGNHIVSVSFGYGRMNAIVSIVMWFTMYQNIILEHNDVLVLRQIELHNTDGGRTLMRVYFTFLLSFMK